MKFIRTINTTIKVFFFVFDFKTTVKVYFTETIVIKIIKTVVKLARY